MLKIKDNVNLKELEKFGFVLKKDDSILNYNVYEKRVSIGTIDVYPDITYKLDYERGLFFHTTYASYYYPSNNEGLETIFDLIQAGLVEKIEE